MVEVQVTGDANNPIAGEHSVRPRLVILPDNHRVPLTDAEIAAERAAIGVARDDDNLPPQALSEAEAD